MTDDALLETVIEGQWPDYGRRTFSLLNFQLLGILHKFWTALNYMYDRAATGPSNLFIAQVSSTKGGACLTSSSMASSGL